MRSKSKQGPWFLVISPEAGTGVANERRLFKLITEELVPGTCSRFLEAGDSEIPSVALRKEQKSGERQEKKKPPSFVPLHLNPFLPNSNDPVLRVSIAFFFFMFL